MGSKGSMAGNELITSLFCYISELTDSEPGGYASLSKAL